MDRSLLKNLRTNDTFVSELEKLNNRLESIK
mgnify:CR=1 FL=1